MAGDAETNAASGGGPQAMEALACVTCRARKLKCDRIKPACARCVKVGSDCVYPESRRKPTFKRRNVRELEARLAQVEVYLKEVSKHDEDGQDEDGHGEENANSSASSMDTESRTAEYDFATEQAGQSRPSQGHTETPMELPDLMPEDGSDNVFADAQLMNLGLSEALPPFEIMEELNTLYFNHHYANLPIVHPGRFWQAFYGSPLRKPPMSLQYAIWAIAALFHEKYDKYSEIFYTRARQYADGDEMKGVGEHFITIAHAQAYVLIATYEANCMLFTRASITGAKSVRLAQMMGLDRLDSDQDGIPPALGPATSWVEMEERRRTFWGAFVMDAHASISTGWPSLINSSDVVTRLPAPDSAFLSGAEEQSCFLEEALRGGQYSGFASTVVVCSILKAIMHHVHRPKPYDRPEDLMNGPFWVRHRELDNELSNAFMFLPENLSLPRNIRDPTALFTNLNLHAAVICLHHAAIEKAEENGHADTIKRNSVSRLKATAEEVCNIIKLISHNTAEAFKSPLAALSLYCASTVYIYLARDDPENSLDSIDRANLEILISAMEASTRVNRITSVFLRQVWLDVESNGLEAKVHIPALKKYRDDYNPICSSIPMIAPHAVGRHSMIAPVLPGRLPLGKPQGKLPPSGLRYPKTPLPPPYNQILHRTTTAFEPVLGAVTRNISYSDSRKEAVHCQKRKRMSPSPIPSGRADLGGVGGMSARDSTGIGMDFENQGGILGPGVLGSSGTEPQRTQPGSVALPDRTNSSSSSSPLNRVSGYAETQSGSSHTSPGIFGLGNTAEENRVDLRPFQGRIATPIWQTTAEELFLAQISGCLVNNTLAGDGTDTWGILDEQLDWGGNSSSAN